MRRLLMKAASDRKVRKASDREETRLLQLAELMSHEYPQGTSKHYIATQIRRNR